MKHSIRQRVIDPVTGLKVTKIETVNGELGSGIFDKNGKEIFEGDIVKADFIVPWHDEKGFCVTDVHVTVPVVFKDGAFSLHVKNEDGEKDRFGVVLEDVFEQLQKHPSNCYEIVGHVDD